MKNRFFIGTILTATVLYLIIIIFFSSLIMSLPLWFWRPHVESPGQLWLIPLMILTAALIIPFILKNPRRRWLNLTLLILLGYTFQMSLCFLSNIGLQEFRYRQEVTVLAGLTKVAVGPLTFEQAAFHYENIADTTHHIALKTKPPGSLMFYMLTQRLSDLMLPADNQQKRLANAATFSSWFFPLICCLAVIPIFFFSRLFVDDKQSFMASILYPFIANITLMAMNLDQVLYPILFIFGLYLAVDAFIKNNTWLTLAAGAFAYLALYFAFSLLPLISLSFLLICAHAFIIDRKHLRFADFARYILYYAAGFLVVLVAFKVLLDYNILLRYQKIMDFHHEIKPWFPGLRNTIYFVFLNHLEFSVGVGIPLVCIFIAGLVRVISNLIKNTTHSLNTVVLSIAITTPVLSFFGRATNEVARYWIFLVPLFCLVAVVELQERFPGKLEKFFYPLLSLQFIVLVLSKIFIDF